MRTLTNMPTDWSMLFVACCSLALVVVHAASPRDAHDNHKFPLWPAVFINAFLLAVARLTGTL